jgi:NTP pyrophosphatase (non-canonical NTP hydrolase)
MWLELFQNVQKGVHENSKSKGFWEGEANQNIPTKLMLMVSELAEAMEAHRKPHPEYKLNEIQYWSEDGGVYPEQTREHKTGNPMLKPEGFPIEMADCIIRIMDLCEWLGIDLAEAILIKAEFNRTRPKMHGGRAY